MNAQDFGSAIVYLWVSFKIISTLGVAAVLFWAIKSGKYRDQDRARYLALRSQIQEPRKEGKSDA